MPYPVPSTEGARMAVLEDLEILDTPAEALYDDVVALAAAICRTPIAVVNLVDADRQWGKALVGLPSSEAPREQSFCARTIVAPDGTMVVPDTLQDATWAQNAMVLGAPHLRFYAGAAIHADGQPVGTLCVADSTPRELDPQALSALQVLARQVSANLELRLRSRELRAANSELRRLAVQDPLTGLANRTLLLDRLELALRVRARARSGGAVGVLFGDLDGLKHVNDTYGHHAGDELLRAVGRRLARRARGTDTVARIAGDEFVIVCSRLPGEAELTAVGERLSTGVAAPVPGLPDEIVPRLSFGAAIARDGEDAAGILARADAAMYVAKQARRAARVLVAD